MPQVPSMLFALVSASSRDSLSTSTRHRHWPAGGRHGQRSIVPTLGALLLLATSAASARAQTPVENGFRDFSYGTAVTAEVTGEKAESKVWWNDGAWWGCLFSPSADRYRIFRFDAATQAWIDTGTSIDDRRNSKADTLWDEASQQLYIVSHVYTTNASATTSSASWGRLYRFSYSSAQRHYTLDTGFPVHVTRGTAEVLTIAKDSADRLWVTHVEGGRVKINWSLSGDSDWGLPIDLPVSPTALAVNTDDISAVLAFGGARVGVMWSNQNTRSVYFAHRWDTASPTVWQLETVLPNLECSSGACADDHINLTSDAVGRVFGVVKTSLSGSTSPLILLVARAPAGAWTDHTVHVGADASTRPIVVLDEEEQQLHVATASRGSIYLKTTDVDGIAFASGPGERLISSSLDSNINNPTSTKQRVSSTTGLLVLASDASTRRYLHNFIPLDGSPAPSVPRAPTGLTANAVSSTSVDLGWTDGSDDETAFHVERAVGSGSFTELVELEANVVTYRDTTAEADTTYRYRVRASNAAGFSDYSTTASATTPASGSGVAIKNATFEAGSLTDPTSGVDRISGPVGLETAAPLKGSYAARFPNVSSAHLEETFPDVDDLYASFYMRAEALPASDARILLVSSDGASLGNLVLRANGRVRLRVGSTTFGESAALQPGQLYRLGIRQRRGTGSNAVLEGYLATADAAFGAPFASTASGPWTTAANRLRVGATTGTIDVVVDDLRLASGAMPEASEPEEPTAPATPMDLTASAVSSTRIDLSWTDASANEAAFHIERQSGGSFAEIATVGANVTSYTDTTAAANTAYSYRVRARSADIFSDYSNTASATTPDTSGSTIIKLITFEEGSLTAPGSGADRATSAVVLDTTAPLMGAYSARVPNVGAAYLEESFTPAPDLSLSLLVRVPSLPSSDVRLVQVTSAGTTLGTLTLRPTGRLRLRMGSTLVGAESEPVVPGQIYRVALRQKAGAGTNAVLEASLAAAGDEFGSPFAATSAGTWTTSADRVRLGATTSAAVDVTLDDIRLDEGE